MKFNNILFVSFILFIIHTGCKRQFEPPELRINYNYLVIEGVMVNSVDSPTTFLLSRTRKLSDTILNVPEKNAIVNIEGSSGENFQLSETSPGTYQLNHLTLNASSTYRLKVATASGGQYVSDFVAVKETPQIDSVNYSQPGDLTIYVNTHDPANTARYYSGD